MKFLFDLLFFLVAAPKRRCRKGDEYISEHRICCRLLFCWFMVAGNTGQDKTWSIVQHVPLWPLTNPCIWSGSWLVGSLVGWCELHQNHPLVCSWDTEVSIQDVSSWAVLWNSGQYGLQGQVHYASILASNAKTNTQKVNTGAFYSDISCPK